jgi:acetyl-CoA C-acetyltransferase
MQKEVYILGAARTPIGKYMGKLKGLSAPRLGAIAIEESIRRAHVKPVYVEEVVMGNAIEGGVGQNPAKISAYYAGLPSVPAYTVNKVCNSSTQAITNSLDAIRSERIDIAVAGGMESMSNAPIMIMKRPERGYGKKCAKEALENDYMKSVEDTLEHDGLIDAFKGFPMVETSDIIAKKYGLTKKELDEFTFSSYKKSSVATIEGKFAKEIVPVQLSDGVMNSDECVRYDTTMEVIERSKPILAGGITTSAHSSKLGDGGAALVLCSKKMAEKLGSKSVGQIVDCCSVEVDPELAMESPIYAVKKLLNANSLSVRDIDIFEHNEAFAPASVALIKGLNLDAKIVNVNGGAISIGHPLGMSGARITIAALNAMEYHKKNLGVAAICNGGGGGMALLLKRNNFL